MVHLEVPVAHALLIHANALNSHDLLLVGQKPRIQLAVRHRPQENTPDERREQADDEEQQLPGVDGDGVPRRADRDAVGHEAAEDLPEAVEAEPDACAGALFFDGIPLTGEQGEARGNGRLEDAEEEADYHCAGEALGGGHAAEDQAPHDHVEGGPFS